MENCSDLSGRWALEFRKGNPLALLFGGGARVGAPQTGKTFYLPT